MVVLSSAPLKEEVGRVGGDVDSGVPMLMKEEEHLTYSRTHVIAPTTIAVEQQQSTSDAIRRITSVS